MATTRKGGIRLVLGFLVCVVWGLSTPAVAQEPENLDVEAIHEEMKRLWDGMAHLVVRGVTIYPEEGFRDEFELDYTNDGRRAVKMTRLKNSRTDLVIDRREDGRIRTSIIRMKDQPDLMDRVVLYNQEQDAEHYVGPMFPLFWVILPDGRPLHIHLDEGATIERIEPPNLYRIESNRQMMDLPITIIVDRERDWLPTKVVVGDDLSVFEVTEFDRVQGRWFPAAGINVAKKVDEDGRTLDALEHSEFTVHEIQFNTPIDPEVYTLDLNTLHEGVLVSDKVNGEERVIGDVEARIRLHEQASAEDDEVEAGESTDTFKMSAEAFQEERASGGFFSSKVTWGICLGALAVVGIGVWALRSRWGG